MTIQTRPPVTIIQQPTIQSTAEYWFMYGIDELSSILQSYISQN